MPANHLRFALAPFVLAFLFGCATPTIPAAAAPRFTSVTNAPANHGVLYVYRANRSQVQTTSPGILIDGKEYASLRNNGYLAIPLPAGDHTVDLKLDPKYRGSALIRVSIEKGEASFVRVEADATTDMAAGRFDRTFRIMTMPGDRGLEEIRDCVLEQ